MTTTTAAAPALLTLPTQVRKRDGEQVPFDGSKIESAILRAGQATGEFGEMEAQLLSAQVVKVLAHRYNNGRLPDIEGIQDVVEQTLISANHFETARSYIVYREQRAKLRADQRTLVDVSSSINEYLDRSDWRVSANANQGYSLGGLILNTSGKMIANYWLSHVYPPQVGEAHREGDIHIHDLDMLAGYCAGWSLRTLLAEGLNGVPGKVEAGPPRHMSSAIGQIVNFLGTLQNEWAGAQAFSSFDTYMAPYVRIDGLCYAQVKQYIQELIYNLNVPSRWGCQTPFTNLTFDWVCPEDLREQVPVIGGEEQSFTYGELQAEMDMINRAYIEVMTEGDAKGRIFTFPIPTYNITQDFPWQSENSELLFEMTAKYGLPYFCLAEGTRVYTRDGVKAVEELTTADEVVGSDGAYKRIRGVVRTQRDEQIKVTTKAGRGVSCSDNHRFPTPDGLKSAAALNLGDALFIGECALKLETGLRLDRRNERLFRLYDEQDRHFTLAELAVAPVFCRLEPRPRQVRPLPPFSFEPTRFQTTLSSDVRVPEDLDVDICELLGQILGDGSLRRGRVSLANADKEVLGFFADVLERKFNLNPTVTQCGVSLTCKTIAVASVMLTDWLEHVGLALANCWDKQVPEILYERDDAEIGALLRGLFDTDGTVATRNATSVISFTSRSPRLLQQVLELLAMLSIAGRLNERTDTVTITGERNVRLFAERVGFRVERKRALIRYEESRGKTACGCRIIARAEAADGTYGAHYRYRKDGYFRVRDSANDRLWLFCDEFRNGVVRDPITKIERLANPTRMVDIEVDSDDHLFLLANDMLTHNSNFVSSDMEPNMVRSMCCRLRLDVSELLKRGNGLFGSAEQTGSLGVVTINCARLGYTHRGDEAGLLRRLDELMDLAKKSLELKRKVIQRHMDAGLFPYTKRYLGTLRNHFSTLGVNGINEMIRNFTSDTDDITTEWGHAFACRLLDHVRERMVQFQEETGHMYNLEATPAEGTTYRFAREDRKRFPDILQAGTEEGPYYTNSSQLPVGYTDDAFAALAAQDELQTKYTGGTVLHLYMGERIGSTEACRRLVQRALSNFRLPYITVTPIFSVCPTHGYIAGEHEFCPKCDAELIEKKRAQQRAAVAT